MPKQASFGNGVNESTTLNPRLQVQEDAVSRARIGRLADHTYNYGGQNNGNILSVSDLLNSSRTQNFSYDQLNRLATAGEQGGRWGLSFGYDPWGNFLQQNVTAGSAGAGLYSLKRTLSRFDDEWPPGAFMFPMIGLTHAMTQIKLSRQKSPVQRSILGGRHPFYFSKLIRIPAFQCTESQIIVLGSTSLQKSNC